MHQAVIGGALPGLLLSEQRNHQRHANIERNLHSRRTGGGQSDKLFSLTMGSAQILTCGHCDDRVFHGTIGGNFINDSWQPRLGVGRGLSGQVLLLDQFGVSVRTSPKSLFVFLWAFFVKHLH
jgi:hypothetical protein